MSRKRDEGSVRSYLRRVSADTGIPEGTLRYRMHMGIPLDAPYAPRAKRAGGKEVSRQAREKIAALAAQVITGGGRTYVGSKCQRCNSRVRYESNSTCVQCAKERNHAHIDN